MTRAIADALVASDPADARTCRVNGEALARDFAVELAPVRDGPFGVFHDAYRCYVVRVRPARRHGGQLLPERSPGTAHVAELRGRRHAAAAVRGLAEPRFGSRLVEMLVAGMRARSNELDPIGAEIAPGPKAYFELMQGLADDLVARLSRRNRARAKRRAHYVKPT